VADVLSLLDRTKEVDMETRGRDGTKHRVPIWVLVIDEQVYVASVRGKRGRWWRELLREGEGALVVGRTRVPVKPHRVRADATLKAMSAGFAKKYPTSRASVVAMQRPEVLETALRLEIAG
jgi:hypothetical protein